MLKRIEVKNFKSFKYLDYKCAKLNLLTGLNGAGKSSFVQLMLLLRATANKICEGSCSIYLPETGVAKTFGDIKYCYGASKAPIVFSVDYSVDKTHHSDCDKVIRVIVPCNDGVNPVQKAKEVFLDMPDVLKEIENNRQQLSMCKARYGYEECHGPDGDVFKIDGDIQQLDKDCACINENSREEIARLEKAEAEKSRGYMDVWRRMTFVEAFHIKPRDVHVGNDFSYERWFSDGKTFDPEGRDVIEFLCNYGDRLTLRAGNPMVHSASELQPSCSRDCQEQESTLLEQINAWLNELSPGARLCLDRIELGDVDNFVASIGFGEEDDFRTFKPQNVGLGISYVLPVLSTLLTSEPNDILVIENPEAHIHPKGQAKIGELIARAAAYGVQVFVETHSDHIINGVRVAVREGILKPEDVNIAFFERKEHLKDNAKDSDDTEIYSEVRNIKVDVNGSLSEYPEDFMDEWNNQLLELM